MPVQIEHLQEFVSLCGTCNFTEIAARLNMTQPGLSRHIRQLEREVGVPLFDRSATGARLTASGEAFLDGAVKTLRSFESAVSGARNAVGMDSRVTLRLVADWQHPVAKRFATRAMDLLREGYPDIMFKTSGMESNAHLSDLANGEYDLGIAYHWRGLEVRYGMDVETSQLAQIPVVVCLDPRNDLTSQSEVIPSDLAGRAVYITPRRKRGEFYAWVSALLGNAGVDARIVETSSFILDFADPGTDVCVSDYPLPFGTISPVETRNLACEPLPLWLFKNNRSCVPGLDGMFDLLVERLPEGAR